MPESQSWTWVRDTTTGHCYDLPTRVLDHPNGHRGVQVIASKAPHFGPWPRRPKHRTDLAGQPAKTPSTPHPEAAAAADDNEEQ